MRWALAMAFGGEQTSREAKWRHFCEVQVGAPDLIAQGQTAAGLVTVTKELELLGWDPDKRTLRQRR